eukprot:m.287695 g.287695  ORF g.287695 m.287695 type:complete len:355 (+) comp19446_c0_seq5:766-1830(+)
MASSPEVSLGVTADEPPEALFCSLASTSDQDGGLGSAPLPPTTPAAAAAAAAADNGTPPQAQDGRGIVQVRRVSTAGLFVVAFFLSSGGIYANEPLVLAAPPSFVFGGLLLALVLFGLPLGLISIEMGTAFPQDGGMVVWIDEAFGTRVGKYFYYFNWLGHLVDAAVYPVFAGEFLTEYQSSPLIMKLVPSLTVLFLTVRDPCHDKHLIAFEPRTGGADHDRSWPRWAFLFFACQQHLAGHQAGRHQGVCSLWRGLVFRVVASGPVVRMHRAERCRAKRSHRLKRTGLHQLVTVPQLPVLATERLCRCWRPVWRSERPRTVFGHCCCCFASDRTFGSCTAAVGFIEFGKRPDTL